MYPLGELGNAELARRGAYRDSLDLIHVVEFGDPVRQMDRLTNQLLSGTRTPASLPMDVWRSGQEFHVRLDLPGVDPSSVDITVERGVVTIQADRQQQDGGGDQVRVWTRRIFKPTTATACCT